MKYFVPLFLVFLTAVPTSFAQTGEDEDVPPPSFRMGLLLDATKDSTVDLIAKWDGFGMDVPEEMSLEDFVPNVRSQEDFANCGGWAVGYYMASTEWALITNQYKKSVSTVFAYDPIYLNRVVSKVDYCDGPTYLPDLCREVLNNGLKRQNINRTGCKSMPGYSESESLLDFTQLYRLTDTSLSQDENVLAVKYAISSYHPVVFSMETPDSFIDVDSDGLFNPSDEDREQHELLPGHALTIVGYDDNQFGGAFRVVNSWGEEWGDNGYCWITYADFQVFQMAAYSFETELKKPDLVAYGAESNGFGRKKVKKNGFFEGHLDAKGNPGTGIYTNEHLKKCRGGMRYMKRLVKKKGGYLVYSDDNFKIPIAAVIY